MQEMQSGIFMQRILNNFQIFVLLEESILKRNRTNARNAVRYFHAKNIEEFSNLCSARRIYTEEKPHKCKKCSLVFSCKRRTMQEL
jgi:hypothetical protein